MKPPLFTASSIAAFGSATLILDSERRHIAKANGAPDAQFIIRACNSHAQLVAALEDLLRNATDKERYISILEGTDVETSEQADELLDSPEMKRARAALQAAKE